MRYSALSSQAIYRSIDRLNFLTSTLLNGIIFGLRKSPKLTLNEILTSRKESCNQYRFLLDKKAAKDVLKDAVHPTLLFSP